MSAPRQSGFTLLEIMIVVTFIGFLVGLAVPGFMRARRSTQASTCINNLRQIDSAKDQWAMENFAQTGDPVTKDNIAPYIRRGIPECPAGGEYTIGAVGDPPLCDQEGHTLH